MVLMSLTLAMAWTVPQEEGTFADLTLKLECPAKSVPPGYSLPLSVLLLNETKLPVTAKFRIKEDWGNFRILIRRVGGEFEEYAPVRDTTVDVGLYPRKIEPGTALGTQVHVSAHGGKEGAPALDKPGTYHIKVRLRGATPGQKGATLESKEIELSVREPNGKESLALEFLKNHRRLIPRMGTEVLDVITREEDLRGLEEFLREFGETDHAPGARLALALNRWETLAKAESEEDRRSAAARVREHLDPVLESDRAELEPDALHLAIRTACRVRDHARAAELLKRFKERCSWHPLFLKLKSIEDQVERIKPKSDK